MVPAASVTLLTTGIFSKKFPMNATNKKTIADGIRNLALRQGAEIDGKIHFNVNDQSVTFNVKGEDQAKKLIPELTKKGVTANFVASLWDLALERRASALEGPEAEVQAS